jgi:hypothetical protein
MTPFEVLMIALPAAGFVGSFVAVRKVWTTVSHRSALA